MTKTTFTIDKVLTDPRLLGSQLGDISTWATWLAILKAAFALPLDAAELEVFNGGHRQSPSAEAAGPRAVGGRRASRREIENGRSARDLLRALSTTQVVRRRERHGVGAWRRAWIRPKLCSATCSLSCRTRRC